MTTDELNDSLRNICLILEEGGVTGTLELALLRTAEAIADQLRYRATGSVLAAKEPA